MSLDATTLAVLRGGLDRVVEEMDITLRRAAFSPVVSEACDMANGIYEAESGEVVCQGPQGVPMFIGIMQAATQMVLERWAGEIHPGDVFIVNDPSTAGTHLQDFKLIAPYFREAAAGGERLAFLANTAHWIDVGGAVPGGFGVAAREIFQEGLRVPAVKLMARGKLNEPLIRTILANVRVPRWAYGDLMAQLASLNAGARRLTLLIAHHGPERFLAAVTELKRRAEELMRGCIEAIPDGTYRFHEHVDNDGVSNRPLRIEASLSVRGSDMAFDFSGSSEQSQGPMNLPACVTISCIHVAIKHVFHQVPMNAGSFVPVRVSLPEGSLVDPQRGCAVGGYAEVGMRVMDVVAGLLAQAAPRAVPAGSASTLNALLIGGYDPGRRRRYVCYFFAGGGGGGGPSSDGLTHMNPQVGAARSQPVEILEHLYPVLFEHSRLRCDSAGRGRFRGGFGAEYAIRLRAGQARATLMGDRGIHRPFGLWGGEPGQGTEAVFLCNGQEYRPPLVSKVQDVSLQGGDRILLRTPGGGGYGAPGDRPAAAIERDRQRGVITEAWGGA